MPYIWACRGSRTGIVMAKDDGYLVCPSLKTQLQGDRARECDGRVCRRRRPRVCYNAARQQAAPDLHSQVLCGSEVRAQRHSLLLSLHQTRRTLSAGENSTCRLRCFAHGDLGSSGAATHQILMPRNHQEEIQWQARGSNFACGEARPRGSP